MVNALDSDSETVTILVRAPRRLVEKIDARRMPEHHGRCEETSRSRAASSMRSVVPSDFKYLLSVESVIAARGGIPLIENDKIIGGIGCSSGDGSQDEAICMAAAAIINK